MNNRLAISLIAASLLLPGAAFAQSTTAQGAAEGAARGGEAAGPVGAIVGGTVGAAVGAAVEIPNAVINSIPRDRSVRRSWLVSRCHRPSNCVRCRGTPNTAMRSSMIAV